MKISEFLTYSTIKIVNIHDKRLAVLHYFFMIAITAYVVGYTIVYQKRYLVTQVPIGSVRLSLMEPAYRPPPTQLDYCLGGPNATVHNNFTVEKLQCRYWDGPQVLYPAVETSAMFVTSRIGSYQQQLQNAVNASLPCTNEILSPDCRYVTQDSTLAFIAVPENFTIMIDHSFIANEVGLKGEARALHGHLLDHDGNEMHAQNPAVERIGVAGSNDIMLVSTILKAAGLDDLNFKSGYISPKPNDTTRESYRFAGTVVIVYIEYSNTFTYDLDRVDYFYRADFLSSTEFKATQLVETKNITTRVLYDRHGVRIIFKQIGELGRFDFQTLLLSFVGGIGLITLATLCVDLLALYVLPQKKLYRDLKILETSDIVDNNTAEAIAGSAPSSTSGTVQTERSRLLDAHQSMRESARNSSD